MATSISLFPSLRASPSTSPAFPQLPPSAIRRPTSSAVSCRFRTGIKQLGVELKLRRIDEIDGERFVCRASEYKFPDPIPEFVEAENEKFREHLMMKFKKKEELYGDLADEVAGVCTELKRM